jgi:hypothetical protein
MTAADLGGTLLRLGAIAIEKSYSTSYQHYKIPKGKVVVRGQEGDEDILICPVMACLPFFLVDSRPKDRACDVKVAARIHHFSRCRTRELSQAWRQWSTFVAIIGPISVVRHDIATRTTKPQRLPKEEGSGKRSRSDDGIGYTRLRSDNSIYIYSNGDIKVIVPVFIDDITLVSKSDAAMASAVSELSRHFKLRDLGVERG